MKLWHAEHIPGADLCADLLTKAITVPRSWESFASTVGLASVEPEGSGAVSLEEVGAECSGGIGTASGGSGPGHCSPSSFGVRLSSFAAMAGCACAP